MKLLSQGTAARTSTGPTLPKSRFVVAVSWSGIFFMDGRDKKLLELPYLEVKEVRKLRYGPRFQPALLALSFGLSYTLRRSDLF